MTRSLVHSHHHEQSSLEINPREASSSTTSPVHFRSAQPPLRPIRHLYRYTSILITKSNMIRPKISFLALLFTVISLFLIHPSRCLEFDLYIPNKCLMEEINEGVLALIEFASFEKSNPSVPVPLSIKIQDPDGKVLDDRSDQTSGQFGFTARASGDYKVCFSVNDAEKAKETRIRIDWKLGVAATDWDAIAKKDNLNSMAAELRKLEETVREIHDEMIVMRRREEQMRELSEATNRRVASFTMISLFVCVGVGVFQLMYLRRFFIRKKVL